MEAGDVAHDSRLREEGFTKRAQLPFTEKVEKGSLAGTQVGPYQLTRALGEGGMGCVYEAVNKQLGRRVAIKIMKPAYAADAEALARLFNEARAVNLIEHPGLVQITEFGQLPDGSAYLVMELLRGDTLSARLRRSGGRLAERPALAIASQLASVLAAAHEKDIVHRDLKPGNVMLVGDMMVAGGERVKLLDFGIAKLSKNNTQEVDPQTRVGALLGTPRYMSPEQCRGLPDIDGKSDVYSLGVMMYEMLTGQMPFKTHTEVALVAAHIYEQATPLREVAPNVSMVICSLVDKMLSKAKAERPTMLEVAKTISERTTHHVEEQATQRIGSLPDKETLRAMLEGGASLGQLAAGPPPPAPSNPGLGGKSAGPPRIPTPGQLPALAAGVGSSGALPALSAADLQSAQHPLVDPTNPTTMRGSSGQVAPAPRGSRKALLSMAIAAVLLLGVGTLLVARRQGTTPSPPADSPTSPTPTPATPTVAQVHWSIASDPPGAEVVRQEDGEILGTTPLAREFSAKPGTTQLRLVLAGFQDMTLSLPLNRDVSIERSLTAIPTPSPPAAPAPAANPAPKAGPAKKPAPARGKKPAAKAKADKKSPGVF